MAANCVRFIQERDPAGLCHDPAKDEAMCPGICRWREDFLGAAVRLEAGPAGRSWRDTRGGATEAGAHEAEEAAQWAGKSDHGVAFYAVDLEALGDATHHKRLAAGRVSEGGDARRI